MAIHGKLTCPSCGCLLELSATKAPAQQSTAPASSASTSDLGGLLDSIDETGLEDPAASFVSDMRDRYEQYGERTKCSEKQLAWLRKLANA